MGHPAPLSVSGQTSYTADPTVPTRSGKARRGSFTRSELFNRSLLARRLQAIECDRVCRISGRVDEG